MNALRPPLLLAPGRSASLFVTGCRPWAQLLVHPTNVWPKTSDAGWCFSHATERTPNFSSRSSNMNTRTLSKNLYIHGLRGVLASSLFVHHVANSRLTWPDFAGGGLLQFALHALEHGVEIFFGLSGVVIFCSFLGARSLSEFWMNRVTRIFPVLWVTILVIAPLLAARGNLAIDGDQFPLILAANFLALPPIVSVKLIHPAAWSISYEFLFYLCFIVFGITLRFSNRCVALLFTLGFSLICLYLFPRSWMFVGGVAISMGVFAKWRNSLLLSTPTAFLLLACLSWHQSKVLLRTANISASNVGEIASHPLAFCLFLLAFALATCGLAGIFYGRGISAKLMLSEPVQWLGTISFSFYLWQTIVMALIKHIMLRTEMAEYCGNFAQPVFFALSLPPTLIVSHVSQRILEVKAMQLLRRKTMARF